MRSRGESRAETAPTEPVPADLSVRRRRVWSPRVAEDITSLKTVAMPPALRESLRRSRAGGSGEDRPAWRLALLVGIWLALGALFVGPTLAFAWIEGMLIPWGQVTRQLLGWLLWGALFPAVWVFTRRFPLQREKLFLRLPIHLAFACGITIVFVVLSLAKDRWILGSGEDGLAPPTLAEALPRHLVGGIEYYLLMYLVVFLVCLGFSRFDVSRSREVGASKLEAQLALANLEVLKMQLHPHFLFNTLNAVSALMHRDVDAADRMITLLSDLLRLALEDDRRHQVPLNEELDFLRSYLAIERIRFRDRLVVEIEVDPACSRALVPRLILQPLVENAIGHGIAMRSAAGRVEVHARRQGSRLEVRVWDDGPGIADPSKLEEGVGLTNTRSRLEQMYGRDHVFELSRAPIGGLEVYLEVPFEQRPRFEAHGAG